MKEENETKTREKNMAGCITLGPASLVFLIVTAVSFLISLPVAIQPVPAEWEGGSYTGTVWIGGAVGGTLRTLVTGQAQFQSNAVLDEDNDGTGEYGLLTELAGGPLRNGKKLDTLPYIYPYFARSNSEGFSSKNGFYFRCYVPSDPNLSEIYFVILAWPIQQGISGTNTYLADQTGEIYVWIRGDKRFSGENAPTLDDVFFGEPWMTPINDLNWKIGNY